MKKCEIVRDLLPSYNEHLTSNETNLFIEEHLNNCDNCRKIQKNMAHDINIDSLEKIKINTDDIKCLKKLNRRVSKALILGILIGLLILLVIYICLVIYRFSIVKDLSDKFQAYKQVDNLYFEINDTYFSEDSIFLVNRKTKYWFSNNVLKIESSSTDDDFKNIYTRIIDYNIDKEYRFNSIDKTVKIIEATDEDIYKDGKILYTYFSNMYKENFSDMLRQSLNIYLPIYSSKGTYTINDYNEHIYNIETGLINLSYYSEYTGYSFNNHLKSYHFSFGSVVDSEFDMNEFADYKLIN